MSVPVEDPTAEPGAGDEPVVAADEDETVAVEEEAVVAPGPAPEPTLAEVQEGLAGLTRRLDALAESFEASVRTAVAEEVQRVAGELQHTVAALGRVLVRDLGRLNQILGQHRDAILSEIRTGSPRSEGPLGPGAPPPQGAQPAPPPQGAQPAPPPQGAQPAPPTEGGQPAPPTEGPEPGQGGDGPPTPTNEAGRPGSDSGQTGDRAPTEEGSEKGRPWRRRKA